MNEKISSFESIIPTAITVAYPRTLTDIPYSKEIYSYLKKELKTEPYLPKDIIAVELEARYKLIDRLLKQTNIDQILELAAGYSPRGLIYTKSSNCKYVELELEVVANLKKKIINNISDSPKNLFIINGSAINVNDYIKCKEHFDNDRKVAIINEGLLRYLDFDEKRKVAKNVLVTLKEFGGVWITCDFTPKKFIQNQDSNIPHFNNELSKVTDRNNINWRFENEEHVKEFLIEVGFNKVEFHYFSEVKDELTSPIQLNINSDEVDKLIDGAVVAIIKTN